MLAGGPGGRTTFWRPSRDLLGAGACASACFALYLSTLAPGVFWHDSGEYAALAVSLQMPHPPCHPVYMYLAHVATWFWAEPARALNVMTAGASAVAVALAFLAARASGLRAASAAAAALALGVSRSFWSNAVIAEVYGLGLCFVLLPLWLLLRAGAEERPRLAVVAAAVAGVGTGAHLSVATAGLGFVALVVHAAPRRGRLRLLSACAAAALAGIVAAFLLIPLSAPSRLMSAGHWEWALYRASGAHFWTWFSFASPSGAALRYAAILRSEVGWVALCLALLGGAWLARTRPAAALALGLVALGNSGFFLFYQVFDLQVFFLPTYAALFLLAGAGLEAILARLRAGAWSLAVLLLPAALAWSNHAVADRSADHGPQEYIESLRTSLPRGAVLVTDHSPPEWNLWSVWFYAQAVHHARPDVGVRPMPSPARVRCYVDSGVPVFAFIDQPRMRALGYSLERSGSVFRIARPGAPRQPSRSPGAARDRCDATRR